MKFRPQSKTNPGLEAEHKRDIEAVNAYVDGVKGTVITVHTIHYGQARPYADSVYESVISVHRPNVWTTNGPCLGWITEEQAKLLARMFVHDWDDNPKFLEARLAFIRPEPNPFGMEDSGDNSKLTPPRHSTWRVRVVEPYND